jgi:integrase/recombinase XerD
MLTLYRRHLKRCSKTGERYWKRCSCPMWVEGTVSGSYLRRSLHTGSWERAQGLAQQIEAAQDPTAQAEIRHEPVSVEKAVTLYLADAKARELSVATIYKLDIFFRKQFLTWCKAEGYQLLRELDLCALQSFRSSWRDGAMAKKKKQERLTGFFWFCIRANWITSNPTTSLGRISVTQAPTDYFTRAEYEKLVDATYLYRENRGETIGGPNAARLRTLLMLMRWSGLRIRDAITLERTRLIDDNVLLYQAKTGTPVYVPLPPDVADALRSVPEGAKPNLRYFFWSGNGLRKTAVADWQRSFRRLFNWQDWKGLTDRPSAAFPTCCGIHLLSRCCWPEFRLIRSRCFWVIPASKSQRSTTLLGLRHVRIN